ncbi:MAG: glycosyltransferase family A protein [bacterium]|nr:glycosyltransferase family A protein [bacterium]
MKLQVLLSAMFLDGYEYISSLHISGNCLVVNQCDREAYDDIIEETRTVRYIETTERGLSKSRNMAIQNADAEVCILCDNDVEYVEGYEQLICDAFERHPEADIIVFYIKRKEKPQPNYPTERSMDYLSVLKIFSPEIAFRREALLKAGIQFDEMFGAGARYYMGEENIFLYDCLRAGLKIQYMPVQIAGLKETESTWFRGYEDRFFLSRGANYCAMSKRYSLLLILQFAVRKRHEYHKDQKMLRAIKLMLHGRREYLMERYGRD